MRLECLQKRLWGKTFDAHEAMSDCIALVDVVKALFSQHSDMEQVWDLVQPKTLYCQ